MEFKYFVTTNNYIDRFIEVYDSASASGVINLNNIAIEYTKYFSISHKGDFEPMINEKGIELHILSKINVEIINIIRNNETLNKIITTDEERVRHETLIKQEEHVKEELVKQEP